MALHAGGHGQGVLHDPDHADEGGLVLADAGRGQVNEEHLAAVHDALDVDRLAAGAEDGPHGGRAQDAVELGVDPGEHIGELAGVVASQLALELARQARVDVVDRAGDVGDALPVRQQLRDQADGGAVPKQGTGGPHGLVEDPLEARADNTGVLGIEDGVEDLNDLPDHGLEVAPREGVERGGPLQVGGAHQVGAGGGPVGQLVHAAAHQGAMGVDDGHPQAVLDGPGDDAGLEGGLAGAGGPEHVDVLAQLLQADAHLGASAGGVKGGAQAQSLGGDGVGKGDLRGRRHGTADADDASALAGHGDADQAAGHAARDGPALQGAAGARPHLLSVLVGAQGDDLEVAGPVLEGDDDTRGDLLVEVGAQQEAHAHGDADVAHHGLGARPPLGGQDGLLKHPGLGRAGRGEVDAQGRASTAQDAGHGKCRVRHHDIGPGAQGASEGVLVGAGQESGEGARAGAVRHAGRHGLRREAGRLPGDGGDDLAQDPGGGPPRVRDDLLPLVDALRAPGEVLGEGGGDPDGVHADPDLAVSFGAQGQGDAGVGPLTGDDAQEAVGEDPARQAGVGVAQGPAEDEAGTLRD